MCVLVFLVPESLPSERFTRVNLETPQLRSKTLYGLFVKLRPIANIKTQQPVRPGGLTISDALDPYHANMSQDNKVMLMEWQTNRYVFCVCELRFF